MIMSDNTNPPGDEPDFEDDGFDDSDFEDFEGGNSLADAWRDNPMIKIGMVVGGIIVLIGGIILFGSSEPAPRASRTISGAHLTEVPGSEQVSEVYREAVQEVDTQALEQAIRTQGSVMPTPITPPVGRVTLPEDDIPDEDPLERWRRIQEERTRRVEERPEQPQVDPHSDTVQALAEAMASQMQSVLQSKEIALPRHAQITAAQEFVPPWAREPDVGPALPGAPGAPGTPDDDVVRILLPVGTIAYAQLLTEADSDIPGPILARIAGGPLSGSRLLGQFSVAEGDNYLVLQFNTIVIDGVGQSINAIAVNPDNAKIGMVTDVDNRYFKRIALPAAAAFIQGFSAAAAATGGTTVTVGQSVIQQEPELNTRQELMKGVEGASSVITNLMMEEAARTRVRVRVRSGTPMGILFLQPVLEGS